MANTPRPRRRKKKHSPLFAPLSFIVICAAVFFGLSVFFRVSPNGIEVNGATQDITAEDIIRASNIAPGDNLIFLDRIAAISRIKIQLPYVEDAQVTRVFPNKVIITVSIGERVAFVRLDSDIWAINKDSKVLEKIDSSQTAGLIEVVGLTPLAPKTGEVLTASPDDAPKVGYLADILDAIQTNHMQADVTRIDMSNPANPNFDYLGRFTVKMGANDNTAYKIEELLQAISQLNASDPNAAGTFDMSALSESGAIHFSPN
ncbi:MAG: FtsQ-type POTRA domain-containing protein [Firmicutes bacterium]|nr:FtsQ-type POTRA domain-containing protein [Bacillota bacterium]